MVSITWTRSKVVEPPIECFRADVMNMEYNIYVL